MKPLYTEKEFQQAKADDKLKLKCYYCSSIFKAQKKEITRELKIKKGWVRYCSIKCGRLIKNQRKKIICKNCNKSITRVSSQVKRYKNHFCSHSCRAIYSNKYRTCGTNVSKLEIWLQEQLTNLYPDLDIHFNRKNTIRSELDIYIPSLNIAFELNGIFHYEPIFGIDKLEKIQNNDQNKFKACIDAKINLCIIDSSQQKRFTPKSSFKFLSIITDLIDNQ